MRTIKEVLQVMLDNKHLFVSGLCNWATLLKIKDVITIEEYQLLKNYIENNRPDYFSWTNFVSDYKQEGRGFFFPVGKIKPRIYWIKRHIKKLS